MKNFVLIALLSLLFIGCDDIDEPLKPSRENCADCIISSSDQFITEKAGYIEEFTGITCNNCPKAAEEAKRLKDANPGKLVIIGIHASNFADPQPNEGYTADFRTTEGTEFYNFANPTGVPSGPISRVDHGQADFAKPYRKWEDELVDILANPIADIGLLAHATYDSTSTDTTGTNKICLEVKFKAVNDLSARNIFWTAYIAESGIVAAQKMPDNSKNKDYVHNHVLRASFNGTFGEAIPNFAGTPNSTACSSRTLVKHKDWVAENLEVIIFAYDADSYEVLQAIETHLDFTK